LRAEGGKAAYTLEKQRIQAASKQGGTHSEHTAGGLGTGAVLVAFAFVVQSREPGSSLEKKP
jgi:hypothetical protein